MEMDKNRMHSKLAMNENMQCCKHCDNMKRYYALQIFLLFTVSVCTYLASISHHNCSCSAGTDGLKQDIQVLQRKVFELLERQRETWNVDLPEEEEEHLESTRVKNLTNVDMLRHRFKRKASKKHPNRPRRHKKRIAVVHLEGHLVGNPVHIPKGIYHKWHYADWFYKLKHKPFQLDYNKGTLRIKRGGAGLYILYAQITMLGNVKHGFYVYKNKSIICTCNNAFEVHNNSSQDDAVSCSTFGIFPLEDMDEISIGHTSNMGTKALFDSNSSYFGLYKIASYKNKKRAALI